MSDIKMNEGFREKAYLDPSGKNKAVGYGFNIDDPAVRKMVGNKKTFTKPEADKAFQVVHSQAKKDAAQYIGKEAYAKLTERQRGALDDMAYNMGINKLSSFKKLRSKIISGDFEGASKEILSSKYAKQVGKRAHRNAESLASGGRVQNVSGKIMDMIQ